MLCLRDSIDIIVVVHDFNYVRPVVKHLHWSVIPKGLLTLAFFNH